jgi:hypothetical protein
MKEISKLKYVVIEKAMKDRPERCIEETQIM